MLMSSEARYCVHVIPDSSPRTESWDAVKGVGEDYLHVPFTEEPARVERSEEAKTAFRSPDMLESGS